MMHEDMTAFERQLSGEVQGLMGPIYPVDDRAVFEAVAGASQPRRSTMFAVLGVAAAGLVVTLLAGSLLLAALPSQQREDMGPPASPTPLVATFTDPVGDVQRSIGVPVGTPRPDGPDIVVVSTSATHEEVDLAVELVDDWALAESTLWVTLLPDPIATTHRDGPPPPNHFCDTGLGAFVQIAVSEQAPPSEPEPTPGGDPPQAPAEWPTGAWITPVTSLPDYVEEPLPYEVDGTTLRVTISLAYLGDPETLSLGRMRVVGLDATASEGDYFPNEQDTCVPVPLPVERADG